MVAILLLAMSLSSTQSATDDASRARELVTATDAALARGQYQDAIKSAEDALRAHEQLGLHADAAWDLNAIGLANFYLARYAAALDAYRRALDLDRASDSADGTITRLNNIGNVHFMLGRYSDALQQYQDALRRVDTAPPRARERLHKMTVSNLAVLNQRLGADERALDYYGELSGETMQPAEEAQLLVNRGALFRRLGDPVKALELYRSAQRLFATSGHRDGEIGAWRNIGILYALELGDAGRALDAFDTALRLARASSNRLREAQALLYRGEALRRAGRLEAAELDLQAALDAASGAGLVEEQWKALYGIGRVREANRDGRGARTAYERAIAAIESVRSDLRTLALRSEFLADRRDVYDALVWLRAAERPAPVADLFRLIEQSRARTWQDRLQTSQRAPSLADVQARLPADTWLLEYWTGSAGTARLWIARDAADVTTAAPSAETAHAVQRFIDDLAHPESDWRRTSALVGRSLLAGLPDRPAITRLLIVPDGTLSFVPFEALTMPETKRSDDDGSAAKDPPFVVNRFDVSYLPSAALLLRARGTSSPSAIPQQPACIRSRCGRCRRCPTPTKRSIASPASSAAPQTYTSEPTRGKRSSSTAACDPFRSFTSRRMRSPTRATPIARGFCSRRPTRARPPTISSSAKSTTSICATSRSSRCRPAKPSAARSCAAKASKASAARCLPPAPPQP